MSSEVFVDDKQYEISVDASSCDVSVTDIVYDINVDGDIIDISVSDIVYDISIDTETVSVDVTDVVYEVVVQPIGLQGEAGASGEASNSFEGVSKNLKSYPSSLNYTGDDLSSIIYSLGGGSTITKTLSYTTDILTSITLSGDTPASIDLTKTLGYTGGELTSIQYS